MSSQAEATINHFSHQHPLYLYNNQNSLFPVSCSGCELKATGLIYSCSTCNYFLHEKCSKMPQKITHSFDIEHALYLLPKPLYPEGYFNCDACGKKGQGFSYHCKTCKIDLHILCAKMPMNLTHKSHCHQLKLIFSPPHANKMFKCGICNTTGSNHWLYRCRICDFDVHLDCTTNVPAAPKPENNFPGGASRSQVPPPYQAPPPYQDPYYQAFNPQFPPATGVPPYRAPYYQAFNPQFPAAGIPPYQAPYYQAFNPQFAGATGAIPVPNFMPTMNPLNQGISNPPVDPFQLKQSLTDFFLEWQRRQNLVGEQNVNQFYLQQLQSFMKGGGVGGPVPGGLGGGAGGAGGSFGGMKYLIQALSAVGGNGVNILSGLLGDGGNVLGILQGLLGS